MENIKRCPYCGKEIKSSALKCRYCGHWLTDNHDTHTVPCPVCGEDIPEDSKICPYCHENVEAAVKQLSAVEHKQQREQELERIRESIKQKRQELKQIIDKEQELEEKVDNPVSDPVEEQEKKTPATPLKPEETDHFRTVDHAPKEDNTPSEPEVRGEADNQKQNEDDAPQDTIEKKQEKVQPALITCFWKQIKKHYADFSGRLSRKEYWYFLIYAVIVMGLIFALFGVNHENILHHNRGLLHVVIPAVLNIGILIPLLGATARRLHDTGRSGWFILAGLIPVLGTIWLIIMLLEKSYKPEKGYADTIRHTRWKLTDSAILVVCFVIYGYSVAASDMGAARHNPLLGPQAEDSVISDTVVNEVTEEEDVADSAPAPAPPVKKAEEKVDTTPIPASEAKILEEPEPARHHEEASETPAEHSKSTHHTDSIH